MDYEKRRDRLRKSVKEAGAQALLVTNFVSVRYLTGFTVMTVTWSFIAMAIC